MSPGRIRGRSSTQDREIDLIPRRHTELVAAIDQVIAEWESSSRRRYEQQQWIPSEWKADLESKFTVQGWIAILPKLQAAIIRRILQGHNSPNLYSKQFPSYEWIMSLRGLRRQAGEYSWLKNRVVNNLVLLKIGFYEKLQLLSIQNGWQAKDVEGLLSRQFEALRNASTGAEYRKWIDSVNDNIAIHFNILSSKGLGLEVFAVLRAATQIIDRAHRNAIGVRILSFYYPSIRQLVDLCGIEYGTTDPVFRPALPMYEPQDHTSALPFRQIRSPTTNPYFPAARSEFAEFRDMDEPILFQALTNWFERNDNVGDERFGSQ